MAKLNQVNDKQQPQAVTKNVLLKIRRKKTKSSEQHDLGNYLLKLSKS